MDESLQFYTEVLGFEIERRFNLGPAGAITLLRGEGETLIELIQNPTDSPGLYSIGMDVADLASEVAALKVKGAKITMEPIKITDGLLSFVEDPNGARIALIQHFNK
jgi:lactoylglutathione lyase